MSMYLEGNRELQRRFGTEALADRLEERLHQTAFTESDKDFIEASAFFFLATADADDKLAASYPFLTMTSVATCGWLMEREARHATGDEDFAQMKRASVAFYLDQIVPEALGLKAAATAKADVLYAVPAEAFAA